MANDNQQKSDPAAVLKQRIVERAEQLTERIDRDSSADPATVEELHRLRTALDAYEHAQPKPAPLRWIIVMTFAVTAMTIALLLFSRVNRTDITLDLELSEVAFDIDGTQVLTNPVDAERLGLNGIARIELPPDVEATVDGVDLSTGVPAVRFAARNGDFLAVDGITVAAGARIGIRVGDRDGVIPVTLRHSSEPLSVVVTVPPGVEAAASVPLPPNQGFVFDRYRPLTFFSEPDEDLEISVLPADTTEAFLGTELGITKLSLERIEEQEGVAPRVRSTVLGGTVFIESLGGQPYELRRGEHVTLDSVSMILSTLTIADDALHLRAIARVRGLDVGTPDNMRSLMPRWLEWLMERHEVALFWGATTYVFLLMLGVMRWWGITR